jgi:hypothetical protein
MVGGLHVASLVLDGLLGRRRCPDLDGLAGREKRDLNLEPSGVHAVRVHAIGLHSKFLLPVLP